MNKRGYDDVFGILAGVLTDVLGVEHVEPGDNFFDIGGHSMTAMRVMARLRDRIEPSLPLAYMFDTDDLGELAELIVAHEKAA